MGKVVSTDFLSGLLTNFRAIAMMAMEDAEKVVEWPKIATRFDSDTQEERYGWLGAVPAMGEWADERRIFGMPGFDYAIRNRSFEATIAVDRETLDDDKVGLIRPRIQDLGRRAAQFPDELVFDLLNRGHVVPAFDGIPFFADTRAFDDSGNIDNNLAGTGVTEAAIRTDLSTAIRTIGEFRDNRGRPLTLIFGPAPIIIVCPMNMLIPIRSALLPAVAGTQRIETGFVKEVIGSPFLTDINDWYVLAVNQTIKPLIYQLRKAPELVALDRPDSTHAFIKKSVLYGIDMRCNVGFSDPRYAVRIVNA